MPDIKELIRERVKVRKTERELTETIETLTVEKLKAENRELHRYNQELRGMIAILAKASGKTHKAVGDLLMVSANRAMDIINMHRGRLHRAHLIFLDEEAKKYDVI